MIGHTPPVSATIGAFLRKLTAKLRIFASRLPVLNELFARWLCATDCDGESYETETIIPAMDLPSLASPRRKARGRDEYAITTVVANLGATDICVYEDHNLIAIVGPESSQELPTRGIGEITVGHRPNVFFETAGLGDYTISGTGLESHIFPGIRPPQIGMFLVFENPFAEVFEITDVEDLTIPHPTEPETFQLYAFLELDPAPGDGGGGTDEPLGLHTNYAPDAVTVKVTTVRRCKCDVTAYVDDEIPIGADLI